jgi:hypothetical protein
MVDLSNREIAEILYYHIMHEGLDNFIRDPILAPYESNEKLHDTIASAITDTGKQYFLQGYLLGKFC